MTKTVKLVVSADYHVPEVVLQLSCHEVESVLNTAALLVSSAVDSNTDELREQLHRTLRNQYDRRVAECTEQHQLALQRLEHELRAKDEHCNDLLAQLHQARESLAQQHEKDKTELKLFYQTQLQMKEELHRSATEQLARQLAQQRETSRAESNEELVHARNVITQTYQEQIVLLKEQLHERNMQLAQQREMLQREKQNELQQTKQEAVHVYQAQLAELHESVRQLMQQREELNTHNANLMLEKQNELHERLKPVLQMYQGGTVEKGTLGEQTVMGFLKCSPQYVSAEIKDTSGAAAQGDFHMRWENLRCLFEIKNKQTLTPEDISKFARDVKQNAEAAAINCAVFVSLRTKEFPGERRTREAIQHDVIEGTPVIYIYLSDVEHLHYALLCLKQLIRTAQNQESKNLVAHYQSYVQHVDSHIKYFEGQIKEKEREIRQIRKKLSELKSIEGELARDNHLVVSGETGRADADADVGDTDDDADTNDDPQESALAIDTAPLDLEDRALAEQRVVDYFIKHNLAREIAVQQQDILNQFSISKSFLLKRLGGFKNIQKLARDKILADLIDRETVEKLKLYKIVKREYPKRTELMKKFIPRRTLDKIGKVFRTKRTLDVIFGYIDAQRAAARPGRAVEVEPLAADVADVEVDTVEVDADTDADTDADDSDD